ncbi:MAG: metallophosphoesterase [Bombella apis]|nr:metallophosphoesterase [Bombella apis]
MFFDSLASFPNRRAPAIHLAHMSDPHLPPPHIPWTSFFNKRLLSRALWRSKRRHILRPDITHQLVEDIASHKEIRAVLISGDITNFGTKEEYKQAATWLKGLPVSPVIVPGNHDFMAPIAHKHSLAQWEEWSDKTFPFVRFFGKVAVIGLNSALPTLPFTAYGLINKKQRNNLARLLAELGKEGYCRVVMLHHPPRKGLLPYRKSLINTSRLSKILRTYGAELVLHGHSHDATLTTVEGTDIPLLGVSAAAMDSHIISRKASWNHLSFTPHTKGWHIAVQRIDATGHVFAQMEWDSSSSLRPVNVHS